MTLIHYAQITDWDDAYANGKYIPGSEGIVDRWNTAAANFRATARCQLDIRYGAHDREVFDLFLPKSDPIGLFVFIHGGYWLAFDKSSWSHLARGAIERGWACAMPSYSLAPDAHLSDMTRQVAKAIEVADVAVPGPIVISGHSAGGHLAARMICQNSPLSRETQKHVTGVVGISGLYDLRPIQNTSMNDTLGITDAEASFESPALLSPISGKKMTCWVGADERPEFLRQNRLLANAWGGLGIETYQIEAKNKHHFNVIDDLGNPQSQMMAHCLNFD